MTQSSTSAHPRGVSPGGDASFLFDTALSLYTSRLQRGEESSVAQIKTAQSIAKALWDFVRRSERPIEEFLSVLAAPLGSALQSTKDKEALRLASELAAYVKRQ